MIDWHQFCSFCGRDVAEPSTPFFRCPVCDREIPDVTDALARISLTEDVVSAVSKSLARDTHVVPFAFDVDTLTLASDFTAREPIEKLRFILNRPVYLMYADTDAIFDAIDRYFRSD